MAGRPFFMMTEDHEAGAFNKRHGLAAIVAAYLACSMAMMAVVALVGPVMRVLSLMPWQAGIIVTFGGVTWMLSSRAWGRMSDRVGRRRVFLMAVGGFMVSYWGMCALIIFAMGTPLNSWKIFWALLVIRGFVGVFFAAIPTVSQALVADHVASEKRAAAMGLLAAASGCGLFLGPALAATLVSFGLAWPLYVTAVLPLGALLILWKTLPTRGNIRAVEAQGVPIMDSRLRCPMLIAFIAMLSASIGQMTVGFFVMDRLGLNTGGAGRVAGMALAVVGIGLVVAQGMLRWMPRSPRTLMETGVLVSALGFGCVPLVHASWALAVSFFVIAIGLGWLLPAFAAMAADAVEPHEQGGAAGAVVAAQGVGMVLGPIIGTLLYEANPGAPYVAAAVSLLGAAVYVRWKQA